MQGVLKYIIFGLLFTSISCLYCEEEFNSTALIPGNFIQVDILADSLEADGESKTLVYVNMPGNLKTKYDTVRLSVSNGKFKNGGSSITLKAINLSNDGVDENQIIAELISSQSPGISILTAQVGTFQLNDTIQFIRAFPERIQTDLSSLVASYGYTPVELTTVLSRDVGFPSLNTRIEIDAVDYSGNPVGYFLNKSEIANSQGKVINKYALGVDSSCFCSEVYIISKSLSKSGLKLIDTATIIIN